MVKAQCNFEIRHSQFTEIVIIILNCKLKRFMVHKVAPDLFF